MEIKISSSRLCLVCRFSSRNGSIGGEEYDKRVEFEESFL